MSNFQQRLSMLAQQRDVGVEIHSRNGRICLAGRLERHSTAAPDQWIIYNDGGWFVFSTTEVYEIGTKVEPVTIWIEDPSWNTSIRPDIYADIIELQHGLNVASVRCVRYTDTAVLLRNQKNGAMAWFGKKALIVGSSVAEVKDWVELTRPQLEVMVDDDAQVREENTADVCENSSQNRTHVV